MAHQKHSTVSRPLMAALVLTLAVGGGVYLHRSQQAQIQRQAIVELKAVAPGVMDVTPASHGAVTAVASLGPITTVAPPAKTATPMAVPGPATTPSIPRPLSPPAPDSAGSQSRIIADASAKLTAGDPLGARAPLNDALVGGRLTGASADSARRLLGQISQTVLLSKTRFKDDPFQTLYQVQSGDRLARIADRHQVTWELLCRINGLSDPRKMRSGQWLKIPNGPFHSVINKSVYRLDVYLGSPAEPGSLFVAAFPVGLGKDNSTPTGSWIVQSGAKAHPATYYSPRGEGVIAAADPKNPLGGYWIGLTGVSGNALSKDSYGIHGTLDPDSIGKQASLGCIRLGHEDIAMLFDMLVDGKSKVVVRD
ncbi:MAG TPA: L,D-transpeptidase family protein [Tepidisphaeraceae bacterium]|nr:L,D-transpeptidase family protein [Tepidisphaeraceae bacterium]